jgi:peptidoglycan hydrolase CwlO-like protein
MKNFNKYFGIAGSAASIISLIFYFLDSKYYYQMQHFSSETYFLIMILGLYVSVFSFYRAINDKIKQFDNRINILDLNYFPKINELFDKSEQTQKQINQLQKQFEKVEQSQEQINQLQIEVTRLEKQIKKLKKGNEGDGYIV